MIGLHLKLLLYISSKNFQTISVNSLKLFLVPVLRTPRLYRIKPVTSTTTTNNLHPPVALIYEYTTI
jgi:hypothetical protein